MNCLYRLLVAAALLAMPLSLRAGLLVTLDVSSMTASPGDTVTFSGSLVNEENTELNLNSCAINLTGISITGDCTLFLTNAPFTISALDTISSFQMFTITANLPYLDLPGIQNGSFDVLGGLTGSDLNVLGTANFTVDVQTPEPATFWLFAIPALALFFVKRASARHAGDPAGISRPLPVLPYKS
jgi:hypothetical protein